MLTTFQLITLDFWEDVYNKVRFLRKKMLGYLVTYNYEYMMPLMYFKNKALVVDI